VTLAASYCGCACWDYPIPDMPEYGIITHRVISPLNKIFFRSAPGVTARIYENYRHQN
jgi:hypothetical protein